MHSDSDNASRWYVHYRFDDCGCCYEEEDNWLMCPCPKHAAQQPGQPERVTGIILSADMDDPVSVAICDATKGQWSHARLACYHRSDPERSFFFESIASKDTATGKTGVRGPLHRNKIMAWSEGHPARRYDERLLNLPYAETVTAFRTAMDAVNLITYAKADILRIVEFLTTGRYVATPREGRMSWTCSEFVTRALPIELTCRTLAIGDYTFDLVAPSGASLPALERIAYGQDPATEDPFLPF